ncbi:MAG: hypothetical protein LBH89_02725 [Lactococcus lactis]|jgi:hypothetical protein|nr:hypothetical protein [Lactococcus lactis]
MLRDAYGKYITEKDIEIAISNGICVTKVKERVNGGMPVHRAIIEPLKKRHPKRPEWLNRSTYYRRIEKGWSIERALTEPPMDKMESLNLARMVRQEKTKFSKLDREEAERNGIKYITFYHRITRLGWSIERARSEPAMDNDESLKIARNSEGSWTKKKNDFKKLIESRQ